MRLSETSSHPCAVRDALSAGSWGCLDRWRAYEETHVVTVAAVGDLMLGDSAICVGYGFRSRYPNGDSLERLLAAPSGLLRGADIVFGNLEVSLSAYGFSSARWKSAQMRAEPSLAGALARIGFNVLNVANNHANQHGDRAFQDTIAALRSAGIACCGVRGQAPWECAPVVLDTRHGQRVGVLGYCLRPRQFSSNVPPYAEGTTDSIVADVRRLRSDTDVMIVSLHWGEEFLDTPSVTEVALGHAIADSGAALVLGHHPHVVRPIERYGSSIIAHSLGNWVSDMIWYEPLRHGAVLRVDLDTDSARAAGAEGTFLTAALAPSTEPSGAPRIVDASDLPALREDIYARAVARTIRAHRFASYVYAVKNLHRYPPRVLWQLLVQTARNKLAFLAPRT